MAPVTPHWTQPSHPDVQEVIVASGTEFLTKSFSRVALPPFAVFANMSLPPCDFAEEPTYATVQCGKDRRHLNLNSDLLYINHSCEPSLIFDTGNFNILAGPKGLQPGDELTFFYPSTEWYMAQPFDCFCHTPSCRGRIAGARDMSRSQLEGLWLNGHIRELLEERDSGRSANDDDDPTARALRDALKAAEHVVEAARSALRSYTAVNTTTISSSTSNNNNSGGGGGRGERKKTGSTAENGLNGGTRDHGTGGGGGGRNGASARELGGEMGGDTRVV